MATPGLAESNRKATGPMATHTKNHSKRKTHGADLLTRKEYLPELTGRGGEVLRRPRRLNRPLVAASQRFQAGEWRFS